MNTDGTAPQLFYTNPDWRPNIGQAIWSEDGSEIYFSRYFDSMGAQDSGIEKLNFTTKETEILLKSTPEMYTNRPCASLPNHQLIFCTDGEPGPQNYIMDTQTGKCEPYLCEYEGEPFTLQTFRIVN